jgi:hypothetical protein
VFDSRPRNLIEPVDLAHAAGGKTAQQVERDEKQRIREFGFFLYQSQPLLLPTLRCRPAPQEIPEVLAQHDHESVIVDELGEVLVDDVAKLDGENGILPKARLDSRTPVAVVPVGIANDVGPAVHLEGEFAEQKEVRPAALKDVLLHGKPLWEKRVAGNAPGRRLTKTGLSVKVRNRKS